MKSIYLVIGVLAIVIATSGCTSLENIIPGDINPFRQSISDIYHAQLDPFFPNAIPILQANCALSQGTWIDTSSKMGCWDIPTGNFDAGTSCGSTEMIALMDTCNGVNGAVWICTANNAGCYYP